MRKVLFRSSVNGYNKKDVNEYIASTDARHAEELAQAERRIAELEAELETSKRDAEKAQADANSASSEAGRIKGAVTEK